MEPHFCSNSSQLGGVKLDEHRHKMKIRPLKERPYLRPLFISATFGCVKYWSCSIHNTQFINFLLFHNSLRPFPLCPKLHSELR